MKNFLLGLKRFFLVICLIVNMSVFFGYSYWAVFWASPQGISTDYDIGQRVAWWLICITAHIIITIKIQDYFGVFKNNENNN